MLSHFAPVVLLLALALPAGAVEVTRFDFDGNVVGGRNLAFTQSPTAGAFVSPGDGFDPYQRGVSPTIPLDLLDDTTTLASDTSGIVDSTKLDRWFGVADLANPQNLSGVGVAEWAFDVSGFTDLSLSIDMAAMGDFEDGLGEILADVFDWSVSLDGGAFVPLFVSSVDEDASHVYTMESGALRTIDDPLFMNGVLLDNAFATLSAPVAGAGSTLTLRLDALMDGSDEGYAFDTIVVSGSVPEPRTTALLLAGIALAAAVRRSCSEVEPEPVRSLQ